MKESSYKQKISIVIPIYNVENYLRQCLDSIVNQSYKNIEIICINDGSTDNSLQILNEYASQDNRFVVISQENTGLSGARNAGIKVSTGEYIMFVDSDDWIDIEMCEALYTAMTSNNVYAAMCCYIKEFGTHVSVTSLYSEDKVFSGETFYQEFYSRLAGLPDEYLSQPQRCDELVSPCMQLFSKKYVSGIEFRSLKEIGTSEDWLFQLEVYARCKSVVYVNKPYYHYRKTNSASVTTVYKPQLYQCWQKMFSYAEGTLKQYGLYEVYKKNFWNKVAVSLLLIGLHEIKSNNGITEQAKKLMIIRCSGRYEKAFMQMDIKKMTAHWRFFFSLCRNKRMKSVVVMLKIIDFLRTHI